MTSEPTPDLKMTDTPARPLDDAPDPGRARFGPFAMLCGVGLFAIFSSTMSKTPVLPLFAKHLGVTDQVLGLIAAASTVVGIVVSLPAGVLSDILGRRAVLLTALWVFATAPLLYLFVNTSGALVAVRLYHGLATAIFGPVALAYVADLTAERRAERMGWYSSATLVGRSVAPMLGGVLILVSYHAVYLGCAVGGILALALGFMLPRPAGVGAVRSGRIRAQADAQRAPSEVSGQREDAPAVDVPPLSPGGSKRRRERGPGGEDAVLPSPGGRGAGGEANVTRGVGAVDALLTVARNRTILVTSVVEAMQYLAFGAVETFLPVYALAQGISEWQIGLIFGAQIVTLALTKPLSGRVSDRLGRRPVIASGLLLNALALVGLTLYPHFWGFLIGATAFGLAMSVVTASTSALVADESRRAHYGTSLGVLSTIMDVGHASGPVAAGFAIGVLQYPNTYRALAVVMVLATGLFLAAAGHCQGSQEDCA